MSGTKFFSVTAVQVTAGMTERFDLPSCTWSVKVHKCIQSGTWGLLRCGRSGDSSSGEDGAATAAASLNSCTPLVAPPAAARAGESQPSWGSGTAVDVKTAWPLRKGSRQCGGCCCCCCWPCHR